MEIQTSLARASSFSELLQIAEHAEPHLSFWGSEFLSVSGYEGTLSINALAARTLELLNQLNYEFSEVERENGMRLASKIDDIYCNRDELPKNSHCITKIMRLFRVILSFEWIFYDDTHPRTRWHGDLWLYGLGRMQNDDFEYYTHPQFQQKFGLSPEEAVNRQIDLERKDNPQRWKPPRWLQRNPHSWHQNVMRANPPEAQARIFSPNLLVSS